MKHGEWKSQITAHQPEIKQELMTQEKIQIPMVGKTGIPDLGIFKFPYGKQVWDPATIPVVGKVEFPNGLLFSLSHW